MADRAEHHVSNNVETVEVKGNRNTTVGNVVANKIVLNFVNKQPEVPRTASNLPSNIEDTSIREYYDTLCLAAPLPWYPDYTWDIAEIYTELTIEGSGERIPLEKLFEYSQKGCQAGSIRRILIEGDAGYGKSTLTLKLASDWAKRKNGKKYNYLNHFDLFLIAQLGRVEESGDLLNHLKSIYDEKINVPLEVVLKGHDDLQVLIVLDGYDEAKDAIKKNVGRIMEKSLWSKSHVIVTSRFGHVPQPIKKKNFCLTVKGYDTKQVAVAVGKFFIKSGQLTKENAVHYSLDQTTEEDFESIDDSIPIVAKKLYFTEEQFKTFLHNVLDESPYKELAQCPLLCAMMCCLICEFPNYKLPETLSELYFAMINRNLCRADAKDSIAVGDDFKEWDWDFYKRNFDEDHHGYLYKFGSLCLEGLIEKDMLFTLFHLTGEKKAMPSDPKILQLVKAGVVIKSFGESVNTMYQVPHRTMAEFLAAYYLAKEKDTRKVEISLLKLCARESSFMEICAFCFELRRGKIVVDAFSDVKLPDNALSVFGINLAVDPESFVKEIAPALSCSLKLHRVNPCLLHITKFHPNLLSVVIDNMTESQVYHELMDLMKKGFNLTWNGTVWSVERTALLNENSAHPSFTYILNSPDNGAELRKCLRMLVEHRIQLDTIDLTFENDVLGVVDHQLFLQSPIESIVVRVKLLLQSDSCPKAMAFTIADKKDQRNLYDTYQNLPDNCMLERLHLKTHFNSGNLDRELMDRIVEVPSKRCKKLSLSLGSRLSYFWMNEHDFWNLLVSNLEELTLENVTLIFESEHVKKNNASAGCKLKKLTLKNVKSLFPDTYDFNLDTTSFALDTLEVVYYDLSPKLLQWLALSFCSLRQLKLYRFKFREYSMEVLVTLASKHAKTLKFLDLCFSYPTEEYIGQLQDSIRRFPRLEGVELCILSYDRSLACEILNVQSLKTLTYSSYEDPFFIALAGLAYKWPGKDGLAPGQTESTLALKCLRRPNAAKMILFFRERDIDLHIKEIGVETYEIWFPPKSVPPIRAFVRKGKLKIMN